MSDKAPIEDLFGPYVRPRIQFESIVFSDGETVELRPTDIVVFVGPNNAGKSAALRELGEHIGGEGDGAKVVPTAKVKKIGTASDLESFLAAKSETADAVERGHFQGYGFSIFKEHVVSRWKRLNSTFRDVFCRHIGTESRIKDSNPADGIEIPGVPLHPIHLLFADDRLEDRISGYFEAAFGQQLTVDKGAGSTWPLRVGTRPEKLANEDRVATSYLKRFRSQAPLLHEQGDGMRSFASVILRLLSNDTATVLLLDEPEAFLHPPQARLIGSVLAKERPVNTQLFVATHSQDVLLGLLNADPENLRIIRLQREGAINHARELPKDKLDSIAADPVMKYSLVLSGIFHQRVVICESDADCMFYNAILDLPEIKGDIEPDILFVHSNGKHRSAVLAETFTSLGVPVDVVVDIDALNDDKVFKRLVTALGGDWAKFKDDWLALKKAIEECNPPLSVTQIKKKITDVLEGFNEAEDFPGKSGREIVAILKEAKPWQSVKKKGESAIPSGQATQTYQTLRGNAEEIGLWLVPVGEMEGFCRSVGNHGPRWVQQVLETKDLRTDEELESARKFVKKIWQRPLVKEE